MKRAACKKNEKNSRLQTMKKISRRQKFTRLLLGVTLAKSGRIGGALVLPVGPRAGVAETETSLLRQVSSSAEACGADANISLKTGFRSFFGRLFRAYYGSEPPLSIVDSQQSRTASFDGPVIWSLENSTTNGLLRVQRAEPHCHIK